MSVILDALGIDTHDPEVIELQQDFNDFADLISMLVERRRALGLTQTDIAKRMGTKQSAVSAIESSSANPTVQRLQRYARAVGARLSLRAHERIEPAAQWTVIDTLPVETYAVARKPSRSHLAIVGGQEWERLGAA